MTSRYITSAVNRYKTIWLELDKGFPLYIEGSYSAIDKLRNERATEQFTNAFIKHLEAFPDSRIERFIWKKQTRNLINIFTLNCPVLTEAEVDFLLSSNIVNSTEGFVSKAKSFDGSMKIEDIGQAVRNVWIMNIIQYLLNKPLESSPSVFAYSMLYPYTDNYLDDINLSFQDKNNYTIRFKERLSGRNVTANNEFERKIFSLIDLIEGQFPRGEYPDVYCSLMAIHDAQYRSLIQQTLLNSPYENDILGISFEKGGTSVLADAYLVKGNLSKQESDFFFAYGIMLQLIDDLQDVREDMKSNHSTVFSQTAGNWNLDNLTNGLLNFVDYVVESMNFFRCQQLTLIKNIIRKNCYLLILSTICKNSRFYSKGYLNFMDKYFAYRSCYMKNFEKKLLKKVRNLKKEYNGMKIEEVLFFGLKK